MHPNKLQNPVSATALIYRWRVMEGLLNSTVRMTTQKKKSRQDKAQIQEKVGGSWKR